MIIFSLFIILLFTLFPLILWWYGTTYLSEHLWNRNRFLFWMITWSLSVLIIFMFWNIAALWVLWMIASFCILFLILWGITWWITRKGSPFIRWFLRKVIVLHSILFSIVFLLGILGNSIFSLWAWFIGILSGIGTFLIAASIEEWVKHVSTLGLTSREFRFSRRDFLLFTFFVTLGFVTLENAIYMFSVIWKWPWDVFVVGITRILFSLPIHVFSAAICVVMWWEALSFRFFSFRYIALFLLWYVGATFIHWMFNVFVNEPYIIPVFVLTGVWYFSFTQWIIQGDES